MRNEEIAEKDNTDNKKIKEWLEKAMSDSPDLSELLKPNSAAQLIWPDEEIKYGPEDYYDADRKEKK